MDGTADHTSKMSRRRTGESAWTRDNRVFAAPKPPLAHYLRAAAESSGRSPFSLAREYVRLARGRGRITLREYVQLGVYRGGGLRGGDRTRFVSELLCWPIAHRCNDVTWQAATEDKWLCAQLLDRAGAPTPSILAVIDTTDRGFPGTSTIRTAGALAELAIVGCRDGASLFCKPNRGLASFGAFVVDAAEPDRLHVAGEGWMDYEACLRDLIGGICMLVQPVQRNHAFLVRYAQRLATVRVYLLRTDAGVKIPFAVLKMAAGENIADNFWRPGNLACDVDPVDGVIRTARTQDAFGTQDHAVHPESGTPLVGERLPMWDRVVRLAHECSAVFAPIRYQSMDVAILADGPLIVEVNYGGAFNLPQLASGSGFLTEEVLEFFRSRGYKG